MGTKGSSKLVSCAVLVTFTPSSLLRVKAAAVHNVCGKLLAAGAMGVVSGGGQTTVEIEIFQRGQLPQGWREGDQPRVADGGVGQREALVNISFSPRCRTVTFTTLCQRHTPFIPPANLPLAVASCKGPPTCSWVLSPGSVASCADCKFE